MGHKHKQKNRQLPQQLSAQQRSEHITRVAAAFSFTGPLPPPDVLTKYNDALPGAAERIVAMAERQSAHRQEIEKTVIGSNAFVQKVGPFLGFIVAMTVVGGGLYLIAHGQSLYGLSAVIAALASLAGVFIYGKATQKRDLEDKARGFIEGPQRRQLPPGGAG